MQVENQNRGLGVLARIIHEGFYLPAATGGLHLPACACPHADRQIRRYDKPFGRSTDWWGLAPFFLAPAPVLRTTRQTIRARRL